MGKEKTGKRDACRKLVLVISQFRHNHMIRDISKILNEDQNSKCMFKRSEFMLLFAIEELSGKNPEGISVSELSSLLDVKPPTITPTIAELERKGMILRATDLNDRRVVRISFTEQGKKFVDEGSKHFMRHIEDLVDYLGEEKSRQFADILEDIYAYSISLKNKKQKGISSNNMNLEAF